MDEHSIRFVLELGRALHRYGTPAHRLEEALRTVCVRLGLEAESFTTPTAIIISFGDPTALRTRMLRVESGELDMGKLAEVDELADDVADRKITAEEGVAKLARIVAAPRRWGHGISTLAHGISAGALAVFFNGGRADILLAAAIGCSLGLLAQYAQRSTDQARVFELVGAAFAAFVANIVGAWWPQITPPVVTIASLIVLLPGLSLTVAMTELATRNLIAGTARLMQAVIVLLELVVGVALGDRIAAALVEIHHIAPIPLPEYAQWIALAAASIGVAFVCQAQPRAFGWIFAACVVGYIGSRAGTSALHGKEAQLGVLAGAFLLGITSNAYARLLDRPALVVQVPAVLLLVPGSMGFRGMTSLLDKDTLSGVESVFAAFVVALAIAGGLLVANAVVSPRRSL